MFSDGDNFSRDEIETYRKKLEKTAGQIDKAETATLKEMVKLEKKTARRSWISSKNGKPRERKQNHDDIHRVWRDSSFKNHLTDLQFIEVSSRWVSETQVKIKSQVAAGN